MSGTKRRKRIGKGIYRDQWGYAVVVNVGTSRRERRFPLTTELKTLKAQQDEMRVGLRKVAPSATRGTFGADADRYLQAVAAMPTIKERTQHIELWKGEFGHRARYTIEASEIRAVLERWRVSGLAASTVNHRRTALQHLYRVLDGKDGRNPVRDVPKHKEPEPEARALTYVQVEAILSAMPDIGQGLKGRDRDDASKTKARLRVLAYTGMPAAQLRRLERKDVQWHASTIVVSGRQKGHGTRARTLPLTAQALAALRTFDTLDCWGNFSTSAMWKSYQRAATRAGLFGVRPYDLRHSYGTKLYAESGDPRAVQELLMHSSAKTTARYTQGAVESRLWLAVGSFNKALPLAENVAENRGSTSGTAEKTA